MKERLNRIKEKTSFEELATPLMIRHQICLTFLLAIYFGCWSQDSTNTVGIPDQYLSQVSSKSSQISQKLTITSDKSLTQLKKLEAKMRRKLEKTDSLRAKDIFDNAEEKYHDLQKRLEGGQLSQQYIPSLDTLVTSVKFLYQNPQPLSKMKEGQEKFQSALANLGALETQFRKAEEIKKFLKERRQFLKEQLGKLGFAKELTRVNKQVYYFSQQVNEYKILLKDKKKAEKKAIEILCKTKVFKDFMRKYSLLKSLFRLPGDPNDPATQFNLAGLQTRAQVNGILQQQLGASGSNAQARFRQNIQDAQTKISDLKNKISKSVGDGSESEGAQGFKPNNQKTKSFLNRLEYGANVQTFKATSFFPVTSDLGVSLGYKLNDRSVLGIGTSFKLGLGTGWKNIRLSGQGMGLRTFIDWKIKGNFWVTGGYEQNYKKVFRDFSQLQDLNAWQKSGLIGLSKITSSKAKMFKKTKLQLLWDIMSYKQIPKTQAFIFRVGYNIK
ncbi:MAG: hypothetical protein H7Y42_14025 [Chitinophagaceae bacterium]|nr:hypothetical protein [Chitinophagaceae bacterium]